MLNRKLVVVYAVIQIFLLVFILGLLSLTVIPSGPLEISAIVAMVFPVLLVATAVLTFPLGWGAVWLVGPVNPTWLLLIAVVCGSFANSLFWNQILWWWMSFWKRYEERGNRINS